MGCTLQLELASGEEGNWAIGHFYFYFYLFWVFGFLGRGGEGMEVEVEGGKRGALVDRYVYCSCTVAVADVLRDIYFWTFLMFLIF